MPSPIRAHILGKLADLLDKHGVVVWYDPKGQLAALFEGFLVARMAKVDARGSVLQARRLADTSWKSIAATDDKDPPLYERMLIYVPWSRGESDEAKVQEPFEAYAQMGVSFGADPAESLDALARKAMPHRAADIDRLFAEHPDVSLAQLEALAEKGGFPLLKDALGTDDALTVAARVIAEPARLKTAMSAAGVKSDVVRLLLEAFGFQAVKDAELGPAFARWILFSEFAFDVDGQVPPQTAEVGRAAITYKSVIYELCDRLRSTEAFRDAYVEAANEVEKALRLDGLSGETSSWGTRDTFAVEDTAALQFVQAECVAGRLDSARKCLDERKQSIWLRELARNQLWTVASRALALLEAVQRWPERLVTSARPVREHVNAYTSDTDGLWNVDRCQRWMEKAAGDCLHRDQLEPLIERAQGAYRQAIDAAQGAFIEAVQRDGWPPEGPKQIQIFARHVAPTLQDGGRVAYFLMDALRFEMGRDLGEMLKRFGTVRVEAAASVVPTTTPFGMAALLPGAETSFGCEVRDGELWPTVGGKAMITVEDRQGRFRELLGDRYVDVRLDELVDAKVAKLRERIGRASLIVVRSDDIDKAGEGTNLPLARRNMSSVLDDVTRVAQLLSREGVTRMVFAADHGHMLLPAVLAGDAVRSPAGEWLLEKRRCKLGSAAGSADGVRIFPAARLGVIGPVRDVAMATGFRVFTAGVSYFHEGLSLQEALIPAVVLEVSPGRAHPAAGTIHVEVIYKQARFNQRVFIVKLKLTSLLQAEVDVRLVAVTAGVEKPVGRSADCDARDPATGLIHLTAGVEVPVLVRIDDDFDGPEIDLRVLDAGEAGVKLGSKKLKNDCSL